MLFAGAEVGLGLRFRHRERDIESEPPKGIHQIHEALETGHDVAFEVQTGENLCSLNHHLRSTGSHHVGELGAAAVRGFDPGIPRDPDDCAIGVRRRCGDDMEAVRPQPQLVLAGSGVRADHEDEPG